MIAEPSPGDVSDLNHRFEGAAAQDIVTWTLEHYGSSAAAASSFGAEDVVLIDMMWRINPTASRVITLDTLRLHTETYELIDRIRERYGIAVDAFYPDLITLDELTKTLGHNCFYRGVDERKACCGVRKVEPLNRALRGYQAWITGMRRDQATTRVEIDYFEIDAVHGGMLKVNPLAAWTSDQVWEYITAQEVPFNALHDQGYPSIGCAPCTRAVLPGEDPRAGRWWWENQESLKECGIHLAYDEAGVPVVFRGAS